MNTKEKYILDKDPHKSAALIDRKNLYQMILDINKDVNDKENVIIQKNKCWFYAFNFSLTHRYELEFPRLHRKTIQECIENNVKFLKTIRDDEFTHELSL